MPGLAYLAHQPPKADLFPWWLDAALAGASAALCILCIGMTAYLVRDMLRGR
jgi:hypothetical protein